MEVIVVLSLLYTFTWAFLYHWCPTTLLVVLAFVYARSYYDGAENTGARQRDTLRRAVAKVAQVVAQHCFSYSVEYWDAAAFRALSPGINGGAARPVIYSAQPHGLFALASFFNLAQPAPVWPTVRAFTHRHVFALPLLRELALALGARDPTEQNIRQALANGESVYVVIDGARGMLHRESTPQDAVKTAKRHDGLLRMAFDTGTLVCPVVHRGHDQVFCNRTPKWLNPAHEFLMDLLGYPFPTLWTMHCAPLRSRVLAPLDPRDHQAVEAFVEQYYKCVDRCQALDHIQGEQQAV